MWLLCREVTASIWAQRIFSLVTFLIVFGSTVAIMSTNGRAVASEAAVLESFSAEDTRTITVDVVKPEGRLTTRHVDHLAALPETTTVLGFGPTYDYRAAANPAGNQLAVRQVYGYIDKQPVTEMAMNGALLSKESFASVGLPLGRGSLAAPDHTDLLVDGVLSTPSFLESYEPLAITPLATGRFMEPGIPANVSTIRILCDSPSSVALVTQLAQQLTSHNDPGSVQVSTTEELAALQGAVAGTLSAQSHGLLMGVIAASLGAICVNVWGLAIARRKDYGRRRALGASRTMVTALIVSQVGAIALAGISAGIAGTNVWFVLQQMALPTTAYCISLALVITVGAMFAALVPAVVASTRDLINELRVP